MIMRYGEIQEDDIYCKSYNKLYKRFDRKFQLISQGTMRNIEEYNMLLHERKGGIFSFFKVVFLEKNS